MNHQNNHTLEQSNTPKKKNYTLNLTLTAMFGALAAGIMFFQIPIGFTLPFIKLDFSDIPVVLGAYTLGPIAAIAIAFIKIALNLLLEGSTTVSVGEVANFFFSVSYALPAVVIYRLKRTKTTAILSLSIATIIASVTAVLLDWFVVIPFYLSVSSSMTMDTVLGMAMGANPLVHNAFTMMVFSILPANLLKFSIQSVLAYFVYRPLRRLIRTISDAVSKK